jgi:hypothetical protein
MTRADKIFTFTTSKIHLAYMEDLLNQKYFGNTMADYLIAAGVILLGMSLMAVFKRIILGRLKKWSEKTETTLDNYAVAA